jgi:hypothetical protein
MWKTSRATGQSPCISVSRRPERRFLLSLAAVLYGTALSSIAASQPPAPYTAVEVDKFIADSSVGVPAAYQTALAQDIARELSVEFPAIMILNEGDDAPKGQAVLRISGTVVQFQPPSRTKKLLNRFSGTVVMVQVRFADASTGQVLTIRQFQGGADSLPRKIAKFCKSEHLVNSN